MRETQFRGKRVNNGEWVYGCLVSWKYWIDWIDDKTWERRCIILNGELCNREPLPADFVKVDPATVGQFTGMWDKDDTEIYEGDIISQFRGEVWELNFVVHWVESKCGFWLCLSDGTPYLSLHNERPGLEVIGNIWENPTLLTDQP